MWAEALSEGRELPAMQFVAQSTSKSRIAKPVVLTLKVVGCTRGRMARSFHYVTAELHVKQNSNWSLAALRMMSF